MSKPKVRLRWAGQTLIGNVYASLLFDDWLNLGNCRNHIHQYAIKIGQVRP